MSMMGKLNFFLRLQIQQINNEVFINQSIYYKELLKMFDMDNCKEIARPVSSSTYVNQDESGTPIDITKYWGMIDFLLYLTTSRPEIIFSVC